MSNPIVLDSGAYLAALLPNEPLALQAKNLLIWVEKNVFTLSAPVLLHYEVVAIARKSVYRQRISSENAELVISSVLGRPIALYVSLKLAQRAYKLAETHNLPTAYDAQYLAVAEHLGCGFWTADEKLVNSVSAQLPWVKWIGGGLPS